MYFRNLVLVFSKQILVLFTFVHKKSLNTRLKPGFRYRIVCVRRKFKISFRNWNENKLFLGDLTYFTTWIGNHTIRHWFCSVKFSVIVLGIFCDHTKPYRSRFLNCISDMIPIRQILHQSINRKSTRHLFNTQHRRQKRCCMRYMSSNNDDSEHQERHLPLLMNYSVRPSPNFLHTFKNFIFANVRIISDWLM